MLNRNQIVANMLVHVGSCFDILSIDVLDVQMLCHVMSIQKKYYIKKEFEEEQKTNSTKNIIYA